MWAPVRTFVLSHLWAFSTRFGFESMGAPPCSQIKKAAAPGLVDGRAKSGPWGPPGGRGVRAIWSFLGAGGWQKCRDSTYDHGKVGLTASRGARSGHFI